MKEELSCLIGDIRKAIACGQFSEEFVVSATRELALIGFEYDTETFPELQNTADFIESCGDSPQNLAEALLWKLGKWKSYTNFCNQFSDAGSEFSNQNVVFYAYARHLKDENNPIYDQHAIRALWAICEAFTEKDKSNCKSLLIKRDETWKDAGSGASAKDCYSTFVANINHLSEYGASKRTIDRLLMPLGQAIKGNSNNYSEFIDLCGL